MQTRCPHPPSCALALLCPPHPEPGLRLHGGNPREGGRNRTSPNEILSPSPSCPVPSHPPSMLGSSTVFTHGWEVPGRARGGPRGTVCSWEAPKDITVCPRAKPHAPALWLSGSDGLGEEEEERAMPGLCSKVAQLRPESGLRTT